MSARLLGAKQRLNKERIQLLENVQSARCSPFVISKLLAARMKKLITARARKNKRTARMLANARKDHSIPLYSVGEKCCSTKDGVKIFFKFLTPRAPLCKLATCTCQLFPSKLKLLQT